MSPENPSGSRTAVANDARGDAHSRNELATTARSSTAFTIGAFANGFLQFGFQAFVTHTINQADAGALFEAMAIFTIMSNTTELGADSGLLRMMPIYRARRPQDLRRLSLVALVPSFVASLIATALVIFFAPQLADVFVHHAGKASTAQDVRILAYFLPAAATSTVICAGLRTWTAREPMLLNNFFLPFARVILFSMFLVVGVNAQLGAVAYGLPLGAMLVLSAIAWNRRLRHEAFVRRAESQPAPSSYPTIAREFWTFSSPRTFGAVFQIMITYVQILLVGDFMSSKAAAAYTVAARWVAFGTFGLLAIVMAVAPQLSRLMDAKSYDKANAVYKSSTFWTAALSWPPLLVLAIFAPFFLSLFGHGYKSASTALMIVSLASLANVGTGPNGATLLMAGRASVNAIYGIALGLNIVLDIVLIPHLGLAGAAWAWTATILFTAFVSSFILWYAYRIEPFGRGYATVAVASGLCFGVIGLITRLLLGDSPTDFALFAIVSCSLYGLFLFRARAVLNFEAFESIYSRFLPKRGRHAKQPRR